MNSGTVAGTSVAAFALLTYFKLEKETVRMLRLAVRGGRRNVHPAFILLGYDLEAKDAILSEIHVSLEEAGAATATAVHGLAPKV